MDAFDAARKFTELYAALHRHAYRRRDPRAPRISGEGLAMLQHLQDSGPLTISEAARHFDRSQSSISERMRRLVDRGLVESLPDERDQRRHLLWLTPAGEMVVREAFEVLSTDLLAAAFERLGRPARDVLLESMNALLGATRAVAREKRKEREP